MTRPHLLALLLVLAPLAACGDSGGDPPTDTDEPGDDTTEPGDDTDEDTTPTVFGHTPFDGPVAVGAEAAFVLQFPAETAVTSVTFEIEGVFELVTPLADIPIEDDAITLRVRALAEGDLVMIVENDYSNPYSDQMQLSAREVAAVEASVGGPFWLWFSAFEAAAPAGWVLGPGGFVDLWIHLFDDEGTQLVGDTLVEWTVSDGTLLALGEPSNETAPAAFLSGSTEELVRVESLGGGGEVVVRAFGADVATITTVDPAGGTELVLRGLSPDAAADSLVQLFPHDEDVAAGGQITLPEGSEVLYVPTVYDELGRYVVLPPEACVWEVADADLVAPSTYRELFDDAIVVWIAAVAPGVTTLTVTCGDLVLEVPFTVAEVERDG